MNGIGQQGKAYMYVSVMLLILILLGGCKYKIYNMTTILLEIMWKIFEKKNKK